MTMTTVGHDVPMTETGWARLHRIASRVMAARGVTRDDVHAAGGPSSAWQRNLRYQEGPPSSRHASTVRRLARALGWPDGTSCALAADEPRSKQSREDQEEGLAGAQ